MPMDPAVVWKLRELARRWDGDVVLVTPKKFERLSRGLVRVKDEKATFGCRMVVDDEGAARFYCAPFQNGLGVNYESREVFYTSDPRLHWGHLIHEMGHVFACNKDPDHADDETDFLGWEYAVALHVGGTRKEWVSSTLDYSVYSKVRGSNIGIGKLPGWELMAVLTERLWQARRLNLLHGMEPLSCR